MSFFYVYFFTIPTGGAYLPQKARIVVFSLEVHRHDDCFSFPATYLEDHAI